MPSAFEFGEHRSGAPVTIAVDMMGGDGQAEPEVLVEGVAMAAELYPNVRLQLFGDAARLSAAAAEEPQLAGRAKVFDAPGIVSQNDKPTEAIRNSTGTSMGAALDSVADGSAQAAVSCGNTGALMAMSLLKLKRIEGVIRPAIAVLWPTVTPGKQTVVLDVGADVRMEARNLAQFAAMGASFAQIGLGISWPRVGLLNIGSEAHKGKPQLQEASTLIREAAIYQDFEYLGFVEPNEIPMDKVDVVVTDGFTGNIALKTADQIEPLLIGLAAPAKSQVLTRGIGGSLGIRLRTRRSAWWSLCRSTLLISRRRSRSGLGAVRT